MTLINDSVYIQQGGMSIKVNDINLVIYKGGNDRFAQIELILSHTKDMLRCYSFFRVFNRRLSIPTLPDVLKCGDIINPKYKDLLKEFLEGLAK